MVDLEFIQDFEEFCNEHLSDIEEHFEEYTEYLGEKKDLNIDIPLHQKLIDAGVLCCFKILSDEEYMGYISMTVSPSMLIIGETEVMLNHIFLKKESRGKSIAKESLSLLEEFLKENNIESYHLSLPNTEKHQHFADSLGMKPVYMAYVKDLRS